jgi:predicted XRE-type DNA-binding protein
LALELKQAGKTQSEIATLLGVSQPSVAVWLKENISNISADITYNPPQLDLKVKLEPEHIEEIFTRVEAGEKQTQIAAEYGVSQQRVGQVVNREKKKKEKAKKQKKAVADAGG